MLLSLLGITAGAAAAQPGSLDQSFGGHGRVTRTVALGTEDIRFAIATDQKVLVDTGQSVLRYLANGTLDRSFGDGGEVRIGALADAKFDSVGIAVDSRNRVLVAGTALHPQPVQCGISREAQSQEGFQQSSLTVARFTSSGRRDPNFGEDGVVSTNFGFPPPTTTRQGGTVQCNAAAVRATGLAVDAKDRPVLTGTRTTEPGGACKAGYPSVGINRAFVARLSVNGLPDPTFNGTGVHADDNLIGASEPTIVSRGDLVYGGTSGSECSPFNGYSFFVIGHLSAEGSPSPAFGPEGWKAMGKPLPYEGPPGYFFFTGGVAVDRSGRILLLQGRGELPGTRVVRLKTNGELDPHFGHRGRATLRVGSHTIIDAIGVDGRGRVLLAGSRSESVCTRGCTRASESSFAVFRMESRGERDRRFGHRGTVVTGFGRGTATSAERILVDDQGHILVGGVITGDRFSTGIGFGLTRYAPGH